MKKSTRRVETPIPEAELYIYRGRDLVGMVTGAGDHWTARDADDFFLGVFETSKAAGSAVLEASAPRGAA